MTTQTITSTNLNVTATKLIKSMLNKARVPEKEKNPFVFGSKDAYHAAKDNFSKHLGRRFIFRIVQGVHIPENVLNDPRESCIKISKSPFDVRDIEEVDIDAEDELDERQQTIHTTQYEVVTSKSSRENDDFEGYRFILTHATRHELDPTNMEYVNTSKIFDGCPAVPVEGDIIALCPDDDPDMVWGMKGYADRNGERVSIDVQDDARPLQVKAWFPCSYQFYRMVTLFTCGPYHSFRKCIKGSQDEQRKRLKEKMMSGSQLATNAYNRRRLACLDHAIDFDPRSPENMKAYIPLKTEMCSYDFSHFYNAIVIVMYFGIVPTDHNVPYSMENDMSKSSFNMKHWHIPTDFILRFRAKWIPVLQAPQKTPRLKPTKSSLKVVKPVPLRPTIQKPSPFRAASSAASSRVAVDISSTSAFPSLKTNKRK